VTAIDSPPRVVARRDAARSAAAWTRRLTAPAVGWSVAAAGALVVSAGYRIAQDGGTPTLYYGVFWLGMLLLVAPFAAVLCSEGASGSARTIAVLSLGVVSFVPKFLRDPYGPLYHDELAHYRAVQDLLSSHVLFVRNPTVRIAGDFPGVHIATATIHGLTGLPVWAAATLLVLAAHTACLVAILSLGRFLLPDPRAAGLAVLLYGSNPSFLYFDTQFAYESLAVCFFLWITTLTVSAVRANGRTRTFRLAGAVVLTLACVMTHHLTTLILILLTATVCAVHVLFWRRRARAPGQWRPWAVVLGTATAGLTVWVMTVARATYEYLSPYAGTALDQLASQATGTTSGRRLYSGDVTPEYERILGMAAPLAMLVAFLLVVHSTRLFRSWPARRSVVGLAAFGVLYFLSVPFILAPQGAEGARRTWGFTYLGLAVCVAGLLAVWLWQRPRRRWAMVVVPVALSGLLVGNTGAGLNDSYRFPGPYQFGSDTRSLSTEVVALAEEFGTQFPDERIVSDRYTSLALVAYGDAFSASPYWGFRTYDLFFEATEPPDPFLVHQLDTSRYSYLVVDERLSSPVPEGMRYFTGDEPQGVVNGRSPITPAALDRFETVPWATKVLSTSHYSVYRLNFRAVRTPSCNQRGCTAGTP
jgi:hypothetical protein